MTETPAAFLQRYTGIRVQGPDGLKIVSVGKYRSGKVSNRPEAEKALNDLQHFLRKKWRYGNGAHGAALHNWTSESGLLAHGLMGQGFFIEWFEVRVTMAQIVGAFHGKGDPEVLSRVLKVVDYYLTFADMNLSKLGWSAKKSLQEYADAYLGIDCNGFVGAYLAKRFPALGVHGGYAINNWKSAMKRRESIADIRAGDVLIEYREEHDKAQHVALIDSVVARPEPGGRRANVVVVQSANSKGGLDLGAYTLRTDTAANGSVKWQLGNYLQFDDCLAPEPK